MRVRARRVHEVIPELKLDPIKPSVGSSTENKGQNVVYVSVTSR